MGPTDFPLDGYPEFVPDVADWTSVPCNYVDVNDLSNFIHATTFTVFMLNIRSCKKNFDNFLVHFCHFISYFSCIILTETWLTADRDNVFNIPGFYCYNLYRNAPTLGGGIKIYIRNEIQSKLLDELTVVNDLCEIITFELMSKNNKAIVTAVYHPPTSSINKSYAFVDYLTAHMSKLLSSHVPVIFAGDTNINLFNPYNYLYIDMFVNNFLELGMIPIVNIPTKVNAENRVTRFSLIDQIWLSPTAFCHQSLVIPVGITDHFPVIAMLKLPFAIEFNKAVFTCRPLSEGRMNTFKILFSNISINLHEGNFNLTYDNFVDDVFRDYEVAFPLTVRNMRTKKPAPWITPRLKQCISKKAKLYRLFLRGRIARCDYISYKNQLTSLIRRTKQLYYSKLFIEVANDSSKTWALLNDIMDRRNKQKIIKIRVGNETITGREMANFANNYFITAVSALTSNLVFPMRYSFRTTPLASSCFLYPSSPFEVDNIVKKLKNKGNKILDIHPKVIKENHHVFSHHLSNLYNLSIDEGEFPSKSKIGRVTPVYKAGLTDAIENYRPITVLPIFSKIFEKLTLIRMMSFIKRHQILTPCQYGFREGRSTTYVIINLMSHLIPAYHAKVYSACFFLDLRKAFDTISHRLLLLKLEHYGFRGHCLQYLRSYYTNRKQYVYINGQASDMMTITHGVPQGSILGPLCFNIFINDLPLAVDEHTVLFADDAAFVITAPTERELYNKIHKLFADLTTYLNENLLIANSKKSKLMMFSSRPTHDLPDFVFFGERIEWVGEIKYLGLTITNKLCFAKHIDNVTLNISRITGALSNLTGIIPMQILIRLYYALAYPHLINHIVVWGSAPLCHLNSLSVRVNNLLRVILGIKWINGRPSVSTDDMYESNHFLKIRSIFKLNLFKLLKQLLDGKIPELFNMLLHPYVTTHFYETRGGIFRHPPLTCEIERRALPHQLITLFESVPDEILNKSHFSSIYSFKNFLLNDQ